MINFFPLLSTCSQKPKDQNIANIRPTQVVRLPRRLFGLKLFPHNANVKIFATLARNVAYWEEMRENERKKRKWREIDELEREEISPCLHFPIHPPFPHSPSAAGCDSLIIIMIIIIKTIMIISPIVGWKWMKIDKEIIFQSWLLRDCFYTRVSQLPHSGLD